MSFPQHIMYGYGSNVYIDLPSMPVNARFRIIDNNGGEIVPSQACSISTINTYINTAASKKDWTIYVASNTGMACGSKCWITDDPDEILIRKISGGTISLRRPLLYDHVVNAPVQGSRITAVINSASANTLFFEGRCEWNIGGIITDHTSVECTKTPLRPDTMATPQDFYDEEPKLPDMMDSEDDLLRLRDLAADHVLKRLASMVGDLRAREYAGSHEFSQAVVFAGLMIFYRRQHGTESKELSDRYADALKQELDLIAPLVPRDTAQDGTADISQRPSGNTRKTIR